MIRKFSIFAVIALLLLPAAGLAAGVQETDSGGSAQTITLTGDEITWLTHMREEEKVARDVYLKMYEKYKLRIFSNIAASEQRHMNATRKLLDIYSLPDPAAGKAIGEFTDPQLQQLYDDLMVQGSRSRMEAFRTGVLIEETDIGDLNAAIATARHQNIITVYTNLRLGSYNHLHAFESLLANY